MKILKKVNIQEKHKEKLKLVVGGIFVIFFIFITLKSFYKKNKNKGEGRVYPQFRTISIKKVIFGKIEPKKEIIITSRISGILKKIYTEEGKKVKKNMPIARISPFYNPKVLEQAKKDYNIAELKFKLAYDEYQTAKKLSHDNIISRHEFQISENNFKKAKEEFESSKKTFELTKKGYYIGQESESNIIRSTIDGTVLELPYKEGSTIIETSINNPGSPIALIADMNEMIFLAEVDEIEAASLDEGIEFKVNINALKIDFIVTLTKISPKAKKINGITKFLIEAKIKQPSNLNHILRAGYKAIGEFIVQEKHDVLTIEEKYLQSINNKYYVNLNKNGYKSQREVEIGISDDIFVEITKGITENDQLYIEKNYD